ncbi:MAG: conserved membrane protein of unknown function [Promethearchaeota archaeon]|nr:MAG: conserved membrane protein of unknown function [Candidatus Lokiarchaeota archaeon]
MSERIRKNLLLFFCIAFIWSWGLWLPKVLLNFGIECLDIWLYLSDFAVFGPLIAAIIVTYIRLGKNQLRLLLIKGIRTNFRTIWLIPAIFLMPLFALLSFLLIIPIEGLYILNNALPWQLLMSFTLEIFLLGGPLGEEYGWRGFALVRLEFKWNALISSLILGLVIALWQLPLYFIQGTIQQYITIFPNIVIVILSSIIYTWLYNNTDKSVLITMILHLSTIVASAIFPYWSSTVGSWIFCGCIFTSAIIILWKYGIKNLKSE